MDEGAFVSLAHLLRAEPVREETVPVDAPPAPLDLADLTRDIRLLRAQLADAFDAKLGREIDALLGALLERLA